MLPVYVMIWGAVVVFGVSAVAGLVWALRRGQFDDPAEAARSIFFDDEPLGVVTDEFPERNERETV